MNTFNLKVVVVNQCQLFTLLAIKEAVQINQGRIVGVESELNPISLNRSIKKHQANLLILTIDDKGSICQLISAVKRAHPSIKIITIALKLKQVPILIKTRMIKAILFANEDINQLVQAIKRVMINKNYYSPKTSEAMAQEIARPSLTPREEEISDLLDADKSRSEIAALLKISYTTVSSHIRNINIKMGHLGH